MNDAYTIRRENHRHRKYIDQLDGELDAFVAHYYQRLYYGSEPCLPTSTPVNDADSIWTSACSLVCIALALRTVLQRIAARTGSLMAVQHFAYTYHSLILGDSPSPWTVTLTPSSTRQPDAGAAGGSLGRDHRRGGTIHWRPGRLWIHIYYP